MLTRKLSRRFKPLKYFLLYIEDCHKALADLYLRLSITTTNKKVKKLLEYMKHKEQVSHANLHHYVQKAPLSLLDTWLDSFFDQSFPQRCKNLTLKPDLAIEDVMALAIRLNMQLIEAMQSAAFNSPTIEAEVALEHLTNQEEEMFHQVFMVGHEFEHM